MIYNSWKRGLKIFELFHPIKFFVILRKNLRNACSFNKPFSFSDFGLQKQQLLLKNLPNWNHNCSRVGFIFLPYIFTQIRKIIHSVGLFFFFFQSLFVNSSSKINLSSGVRTKTSQVVVSYYFMVLLTFVRTSYGSIGRVGRNTGF